MGNEPAGMGPGEGEVLFGEVAGLIERARTRAAVAVNSELVMLYWSVGKRVREEVLGGERAEYGAQVVRRLAEWLTERYGKGWSKSNLLRMIQFATTFHDEAIVATLSRQLSWSIGKRIREDVLGGERAAYGAQVVKRLSVQLTERFGRGWSRQSLERMVRFASWIPETEICSSVMSKLTWTHVVELLAVPGRTHRNFYAVSTVRERWSVRTMRERIVHGEGARAGRPSRARRWRDPRCALPCRIGACGAGSRAC